MSIHGGCMRREAMTGRRASGGAPTALMISVKSSTCGCVRMRLDVCSFGGLPTRQRPSPHLFELSPRNIHSLRQGIRTQPRAINFFATRDPRITTLQARYYVAGD